MNWWWVVAIVGFGAVTAINGAILLAVVLVTSRAIDSFFACASERRIVERIRDEIWARLDGDVDAAKDMVGALAERRSGEPRHWTAGGR